MSYTDKIIEKARTELTSILSSCAKLDKPQYKQAAEDIKASLQDINQMQLKKYDNKFRIFSFSGTKVQTPAFGKGQSIEASQDQATDAIK
jgi:hypothetical protein